MSTPFDIEPRFFARATGQRIQFNPDDVLSCEWELIEAGGTGQVTIKVALPFEQCPVQGGDKVELWATGETSPRCRAVVSIPDPMLELRENQVITAYGLMEDMNHVVIDRVSVYPGGIDLSWFAAQVADDYAARRPGFVFVRDIQTTNVALETFNCANTTARAAMDQLQTQAGRNAVWGWDIDPQTNLDRFYLRPRISGVGHQWFVGDRVRMISGANDFSGLANAIKIQGGDAKYPQLLTNPGFEVPSIPNAGSGSMLQNGGFELTSSGGSQAAGGNQGAANWTFVGSATRNAFDPSSNHNASAHTGRWYLLLDTVGEEVYQEITVTHDVAYTASLYAALESGALLSQGQLIVEGRDSGGSLVAGQTFTLDIQPPNTAWTGGQGSTVLAGDGLSMLVTFTSATVTKARIRLVATANVSARHGLLIDDVVFTEPGEVGQTGWATHLQNTGSSANQFVNLDWANLGAAWEGLYGVRAWVIADRSNKPVICPFPGDDSGAQGNHFKPTAQQSIRCGFRVRMTGGGVNTADGECRIEYREWAGDGHETQHVYGAYTTIPNNGTWQWIYEDVTAHGDAASATCQVAFSADGTYDIDGFTARDVAAGESGIDPATANYLRSSKFERYVRAEDICAGGSDPANSAATYGRRESIVSNKDIVDWNSDSLAWAIAYFEKNAVPVNRNRVELLHEPSQIPSPGEGTKVQISGLAVADILEWPSRIQYTWGRSVLAVSLELSNERPTLAKLLKQISNASNSSGSASSIAAVSAGTTTPAALSPATVSTLGGVIVGAGLNVAGDGTISLAFTFIDDETPAGTIDGSNTAFTLAHTPIAGSLRVYQGATATLLQRLASSAWSLTGAALTLGAAPPTGNFLRVEYRY